MSTDTTLFAHIVHSKLKSQIEDTAVEALGYILAQSPVARWTLADLLKGEDFDVGSIYRIETWEPDKKGAIPDLVCFDDHNSKHVLIEVKFWANLTKNQPNQYLKQLQDDREDLPAALLFIAPKARQDSLWQELIDLAEKEFKVDIILESGPVRSALIGGNLHRLKLISWAYLLECMAKEARDENDHDAEADIQQLRGLTNSMDGDAFLPFGSEDLASESAQQMLDVAELVDDATYHAKRAGWADTEGLNATPSETGYGRYIRIGGVDTWFGLHFGAWARHSDTPLWLSFWEGYREQLDQVNLLDEMTWIRKRACYPITLPDSQNYHRVLNSVVNSLGELAHRFDSSVSKTAHRIDSDFFRELRQQKRGPEFAEHMLGMRRIVDDATNHANSKGWISLDRMIVKPRREGYGRFIRIGGVKAWFGIHLGAWARHCDTPLWLVFDYHEEPRLANVTDSVHEVDWRHCIPIDVRATAEHDEVLNSVVDSLKSIAAQLKDSTA
ncbi:MAG: PD-(D/E)XK nuclease family protein [Caldilineaceae bacterium]|nr:PD-(D/E)XK nuclease family protein [Caldilineaceae bacterium]